MYRRLLAPFFAAMLLLLPSTARASWNEAKTRHFIIYSEQNPDELRRYGSRLERFDQAVRYARSMADPALTDSGRLTVFVLRNQKAVAMLAGSIDSGAAGFYIARASGPVAFVHRDVNLDPESRSDFALNAETVFFHEYLHHLMLQDVQAALPAWMVEGYAEFFATAELLNDGSVRFGAVPKYRSYSIFNPTGLSVERLVGATYDSLFTEEWESIYGRGWLLTHYLTFEPSRRGQVTRYVEGIQHGRSALDSAKAAFGDLKQLGRDLDRYRERKTLLSKIVPAANIIVGPIAIRRLGAAEDALLPLRIRSARGGKRRRAADVAGDLRGLAAKYAGDPLVEAALAQAEIDAKYYAPALAAADRALLSDPNSIKALVAKGHAMMELGKGDAKTDWKAVRGWLAKANRLDPDNAEPLMLFYQTYGAQGIAPSRNAADGLFYAQALVPQDDDLRVLAVRQLISERKMAGARTLYATIAYNPHAGKKRENLLAIMNALVANNGGKARMLLDAQAAEDDKEE